MEVNNMTWKKIESYLIEGIQKSFSIKQKCSEEEKKIYGVNFKTSKTINKQIFELKLKDTNKIVFMIRGDYQMLDKIIDEDVIFKSLTKAKKFVEKKVKEYNEINN